MADFNSPPSGRAVGGGGAPDLRRPSQRWKAPPPGTPFRHPHSEQRRPARRTLWHRCWVPKPAPSAPGTHGSRYPGCPPQRMGGRGRDSARHQTPLTTVARQPPPGNGPRPPPLHTAPTGRAGQEDSVGPPHPHARAHSTWVADPNSPPSRRAVGGGGRLTSDAPRNGGMHPPRGRPSATPTVSNAGPQGRTLWGWCWVPTPAPTAPRTHGSRDPDRLPQRKGGRGMDSA